MIKFKKIVLAVAFTASVLFATNVADVKAEGLDVNPATDIEKASYKAPTGQTTITAQTDYSDSSVKISFSYSGTDANDFEVYVSTDPNTIDYNTPYSGSVYTNGGQSSISGLQAGTTYYVVVRPYNGRSYNNTIVYGAPSNVFEVVTCPNVKPEITYYGSPSTTSIQVNWNPVPGATGYVVSYFDYDLGINTAATLTTAECGIVIDGLTPDKSYRAIVYSYRANSAGEAAIYDSGTYTETIDLKPTKCSAPGVEYYSRKNGYFGVSTFKKNSASGYQYDVYTAYKKKDTRVKTFSDDKYSYIGSKLQHKAFKSANLYKVRCRAYSTDSNGTKQYGEWSGWTYIGAQNSGLSAKRVSGGFNIKWAKFKGASRYVVKISTNKESGYKTVATTTKSSLTIKKCGKSKLKKKTTYYVTVTAQKKVGKKYVSVTDPYCYPYYYYY